MTPRVVSLCDRTGIMVEAWLEAGFLCEIVDLRPEGPPKRWDGRLIRTRADVTRWEPPVPPAIVFAFPPCTDLANSGARWMKDEGLGALIEALRVVESCRASVRRPAGRGCWRTRWANSRPGGVSQTWSSTRTSSPVGATIRPRTATRSAPVCGRAAGSSCHANGRGRPCRARRCICSLRPADRADQRSVTPRGFARAVFEANVDQVKAGCAA